MITNKHTNRTTHPARRGSHPEGLSNHRVSGSIDGLHRKTTNKKALAHQEGEEPGIRAQKKLSRIFFISQITTRIAGFRFQQTQNLLSPARSNSSTKDSIRYPFRKRIRPLRYSSLCYAYSALKLMALTIEQPNRFFFCHHA